MLSQNENVSPIIVITIEFGDKSMGKTIRKFFILLIHARGDVLSRLYIS